MNIFQIFIKASFFLSRFTWYYFHPLPYFPYPIVIYLWYLLFYSFILLFTFTQFFASQWSACSKHPLHQPFSSLNPLTFTFTLHPNFNLTLLITSILSTEWPSKLKKVTSHLLFLILFFIDTTLIYFSVWHRLSENVRSHKKKENYNLPLFLGEHKEYIHLIIFKMQHMIKMNDSIFDHNQWRAFLIIIHTLPPISLWPHCVQEAARNARK